MSKGTLNKCCFIGRLGKDPILKTTSAGSQVCNFSIATNDNYKDNSGKEVEITDWIPVVTWRKLAEICGQYLKKGSLVYIEGKFKTRTYDKDGVKHYTTEIVADKMEMLGDKPTVAESATVPAPVSDGLGHKDSDSLPF